MVDEAIMVGCVLFKITFYDFEYAGDMLFWTPINLSMEDFEQAIANAFKPIIMKRLEKGEIVDFELYEEEEIETFISEMEKQGFYKIEPNEVSIDISLYHPSESQKKFLDKIGGKGFWKKVVEHNEKIREKWRKGVV